MTQVIGRGFLVRNYSQTFVLQLGRRCLRGYVLGQNDYVSLLTVEKGPSMMPWAGSNCRNTGRVGQIVRMHKVTELTTTWAMKTLKIMNNNNSLNGAEKKNSLTKQCNNLFFLSTFT